ncbi:hypothetical protein TNCV_1703411 [Trichonephila clavipes]|nr:hypothetical protein TNCV_1703411 [Trichonephila clavipes]
MASLGHQSLPPTDLGRVDEEMVLPGGRLSQYERVKRMAQIVSLLMFKESALILNDAQRSFTTKFCTFSIISGVQDEIGLPLRWSSLPSKTRLRHIKTFDLPKQ